MNLWSLSIKRIETSKVAADHKPQVYVEAGLLFENKECLVKFSGGMLSLVPIKGKTEVPELPVGLRNTIKNVLSGYVSGMALSTELVLDYGHEECCQEGCELED